MLKLARYKEQLQTGSSAKDLLKDFDVTMLVKALETITNCIHVVQSYWQARASKPDDSHANPYVEPLFATMEEPSFWQVGAIIELNNGHTKEFEAAEELRLNTHLMACGFGDYETSNLLHDITLDESKLKLAAARP